MTEEERKPSPLATLGFAALLVAILVVAVYGLAHASIRPINPGQPVPKGHFAGNCAVCHTLSGSVQLTQP